MEKSLAKTQGKKEKIALYSEKQNIMLSPKSIEILEKQEFWQEILDNLVKEGQFIITPELVEKKIVKTKMNIVEKETIVKSKNLQALAKETEADFHIMKELDVSNQSSSEGKIEDFLDYFENKFKLLSNMLKKRHSLNPVPIKRIKAIPDKQDVDLIGMVSRKWMSKKDNLILEVEDGDAKTLIVIPKQSKELSREANKLMLDNVIGVKGKKLGDDLIIAQTILLPDLPADRKLKTIEKDVSIASVSDIHVGSKLFLEEEFKDFLKWINLGTGSKTDKIETGKIKYLVITGDNVDGIGVYPEQENELAIKDIYEQYEKFSELILQIPEYIEIFITPGNHDAVRVSDPQPIIPKKYIPELYNAKNVHLMGSPSWVEIEKFKTLLYHGASLHDLFSNVTGLDASKPELGMRELLKKRDLCASYGLKHPYVPEKKNYMIINHEPDLIFMGEMHHNGYTDYRGTRIICNGTWQDRTDYQVRLGHVPTVGRVPVINLKTLQMKENVFAEE